MKIVSKYKDYYDGVQALGFDKSLIYVRHQQIEAVKKPKNYQSYIQESNDTLELDTINLETSDYIPHQEHIKCNELIIGFCGRLYPAINFKHIKNQKEIGRKVFYKANDVIKYVNQLKAQYHKLFYRCSSFNYYFLEPTLEDLDKYFNQKVFEKSYVNWFQDFNTPIFTFTSDPNELNRKWNDNRNENTLYIISNPILKEYEFYKVKDNFTAFQELSQFIGGVLTNTERDTNNLSDIDKVRQHGFDEKYGFRTRPKDK